MKKIVLFLHGYGANGKDLIGLKDYINNKDLNIVFSSPDAPEKCPFNYFGYQWFELVDRSEEELFSGLKKSYHYLDKILSELIIENQTSYENIVIIGFSQGAMLADYYGILSKNILGGIISLSGGLPKNILDQISKNNINQKFSIFHGKADTVVSYLRSKDLNFFLDKNNLLNNLIIEENCDHEISLKAIEVIKEKVKDWLV